MQIELEGTLYKNASIVLLHYLFFFLGILQVMRVSFLNMNNEIVKSLTDAEKKSIVTRIETGLVSSPNGHLTIDGKEANSYSRVRIFLRGQSTLVLRHRMAYLIYNQFTPLPEHLQVSHLCHLRSCVKTDHLSLEPPAVNNSRKNCNVAKRCSGHAPDYPPCVFD